MIRFNLKKNVCIKYNVYDIKRTSRVSSLIPGGASLKTLEAEKAKVIKVNTTQISSSTTPVTANGNAGTITTFPSTLAPGSTELSLYPTLVVLQTALLWLTQLVTVVQARQL